jgi:hypothetical protein
MQWSNSALFSLIYDLQKWASEQMVALRIGVHVGKVDIVMDINGIRTACGDAVNYAQRVMDAANPTQVLFSDAAHREHVGDEHPEVELGDASEKTARLVGPMEVYAKHRLRLLVYKMVLVPSEDWWSDTDPVEKDAMLVSLTSLPKQVTGPFSDQLRRARKIAFIQLTGENLLPVLERAEQPFSLRLESLWVLMPHPDVYPALGLQVPYARAEEIAQWVGRWKRFLSGLRQVIGEADIKLGLFREAPFLGASFIDWDRPNRGTIHVSPYIWGLPAKQCPGYDLVWLGTNRSEVYGAYVRGLEHLNSRTPNELNRVVQNSAKRSRSRNRTS